MPIRIKHQLVAASYKDYAITCILPKKIRKSYVIFITTPLTPHIMSNIGLRIVGPTGRSDE